MAKVGVVGDLDSVIGFRALGMDVRAVRGGDEARDALTQLIKEGAAIIFLTEPLASSVQDVMDEVAEKMLPAVILIPSAGAATSIGRDRLRQSVRRATGMDILKQKLERSTETENE